MEIRIEVDTHDRQLGWDLFDSPRSLGEGTTAELPNGLKLNCESLLVRKAAVSPETLTFIVTFASGVGSGLVANWLYDKLKGRTDKLRIERTEVEVEQGQIRRVISEKIERERS